MTPTKASTAFRESGETMAPWPKTHTAVVAKTMSLSCTDDELELYNVQKAAEEIEATAKEAAATMKAAERIED